jgi:tripartite-type tricarboxylate transporter receptor subunit TctC
MLSRRRLLTLSAATLAAPALVSAAGAQGAWPSKPVRLIIPYPPGGGADIISRAIGAKLSDYWGQQVVIESRAGAGGNISTEAAVRAPNDGYTLYMAGEFIAMNPFVYPKLTFNALTDLEPVSLIVQFPGVMVVSGQSPIKSLKEFIALAKKEPGKLNFASPGTGTGPHLAGELFMRRAGIKITHIAYRGAGPAIPDAVAGRVDSFFNNIAPLMGMIKQGQLRALAVTSGRKAPGADDIPTMAEEGLEGVDVSGWYAFYFPAKTPAEIIQKVSADSQKALAEPDLRKRFDELGLFSRGTTPDELRAHHKAEMDLWGPVIRDAGVKLGD